ncbi:MAG: UpxY family transcription antiterminator [Prevotella sp.]|nr:UpxY family transcription antiterminator [Prevotella sp.]
MARSMSLNNLSVSHGAQASWYVLRAVFRHETVVRDALRKAGFRCYVPMTWRVSTVRGKKERRLVPAVSDLVFVYGSDEAIRAYKMGSRETLYWLMTGRDESRTKVIVPDKQMEDFIRVTMHHEEQVTYFRPEELSLSKGDKIIIHGGPFDGVEGVLLKVKGRREKQLVVSIPSIAAASVNIKPEMVEPVGAQAAPSSDSQKDARLLIRLCTQMLTAAPDPISQAQEYDLLHHDIQQLYESLCGLRGYLPTLEGEIALSLLMAERILDVQQASTALRFQKALAALSPRSLLRVRMQLIGGRLLEDDTLIFTARQAMEAWKGAGPTQRQQTILDEAIKWDF